jgi:hypothetical protein
MHVMAIFSTLAKRMSQQGHDAIEHASCDMAMTPDRIENFIATESTPWMLREQGKHSKRFGFEPNIVAGDEQTPSGEVDFHRVEDDPVSRFFDFRHRALRMPPFGTHLHSQSNQRYTRGNYYPNDSLSIFRCYSNQRHAPTSSIAG